MALRNLSKGRFTEFLKCPLTAWKLRHGQMDAISEDDYGDRFRADQGHIIGDLAIRWFDAFLASHGKPHGINIDNQLLSLKIDRGTDAWLATALRLTQEAMANPNVWAIYEGTFNIGSYTTRADILARTQRGTWNMVEVKSSMEKGESTYIEDMAYTCGVIASCGVQLNKIGLMRIDPNYILKDDGWRTQPRKLLNLLDISWKWQEAVIQTIASWNTPQANGYTMWQIVDWVTRQETPPPANWSPSCKECDACRAVFARSEKCHPILDMPHIGNMSNAFQELNTLGVFCIEDIPAGFFNTAKSHERTAAIITETVKKKQMFVGQGLKKELYTGFIGTSESNLRQNGPIIWPVLYLDFEYLMTAIPLYSECHPYEAMPFQYSLHRAEAGTNHDGLFLPNLASLQHRETLTDPEVDGRVALAKQFLRDIREFGSSNSTIMVYNKSAELTCIEQLASFVEDSDPQLAVELRNLYKRVVDLYAIISKPNLYHPAFHGSFKLKNVIKTFIPAVYEGLDIQSGDAALAAYGELAYAYRCPELSLWEATADEKEKALDGLRKYCKLDTYSLIMLHHQLVLLASDCPKCVDEDQVATYRGTFRACPKCLDMISPQDRGHALRCQGYKTRIHPSKIAS